MQEVKDLTKKLFTKENVLLGIFWGVILVLLLINSVHEKYPDEFDNILGGWYILHGRPIYAGFFTHHGPVAYFIASFLEIFSGHSFVSFRITYALFLFLFLLWSYIFLKRRFGTVKTNVYLLFIAVLAIGQVYFWGQMLLADNLSAFFLTPVFVLIFFRFLYKSEFTITDFIVISILTSLSLLSSLTYTYLIGCMYIFVIMKYLHENRWRFFSKKTGIVASIIVIPYILFLLYLLITNSLHDYIYQAITFNQRYYIYNYPRAPGVTTINPIRFAVVIAHDFLNNFSTLLVQVKDFNFGFPFNVTLAIGNVALLLMLLLKKRFSLFLFVLLVLTYANARTSPLNSKETDYQAAVYMVVSFFNICYVLTTFYKDITRKEEDSQGYKVIATALFLIVGIYSFFSLLLIVRNFEGKAYTKYMGKEPLIYDRPEIAPILNTITDKNDYVMLGPFEFEELFYLDRRIPSKYHILIPAMGKSLPIQEELMADIARNKPVVIYFDKIFPILFSNPTQYGQFFLRYLNANYITLYEYREGKARYVSVNPVTSRLDLEAKLYIDKNRIHEVIDTMLKANLIKKVT